MSSEFITALEQHQTAFGISLSDAALGRLAQFHTLVQEHNPLLHLVGPCSAEEFAVRHVMESLTMLEYLPEGASFADVGTGAGLPAIPCLIAREDLRGLLIESKEKKAEFLRTAIAQCSLGGRADVVAKQFSEATRPEAGYVSCRALDRFAQHLSKLVKWSGRKTFLFFGGPSLRDEIRKHGLTIVQEKLMPMSERRYLFVAK